MDIIDPEIPAEPVSRFNPLSFIIGGIIIIIIVATVIVLKRKGKKEQM